MTRLKLQIKNLLTRLEVASYKVLVVSTVHQLPSVKTASPMYIAIYIFIAGFDDHKIFIHYILNTNMHSNLL